MKNKQLKILGLAGLIFVGITLITVGILKDYSNNINGALIGLGSGLIGAALAQLFTIRIYSKNPEKLKVKTVEVNDERNIMIKEKARAKTYGIFNFVLSALLLLLVFMGLKPIWLSAAISLYIIRYIIEIFFINKYMKEM